MFEYSTVVSTISLTKKAEEATAEELAKEIAMSLPKALNSATKGFEKLNGCVWDIISHQMTRINHNIIVSFFAKRPRLQQPS
jgi:hypothetical protein